MKWSPQQDKALRDVRAWLKDAHRSDKKVYRLFGCAGTGKTTLAQTIAEDADGSVRYAAYTGKAASVMRGAGCLGAQTIHSLIYNPRGRSEARLRELEEDLARCQSQGIDPAEIAKLEGLIKAERLNLKRPSFSLNLDSDLTEASLLILDECSMVDEAMAADLLHFEVPILALGDPAQLPPVGGGGYFTNAQPDTMLTEIHRQALDNPIIRMATTVREGGQLQMGRYGESSVQARAEPEEVLAVDQVLVGRNVTRANANARIRELKGLTDPFPQAGEKLVCLRNDRTNNLLNGTLHVETQAARDAGTFINLRCRPEEGGAEALLSAHRQHFYGNPDEIGNWERLSAQEFAYGYALTVHKAQGSQWPAVLLFDEWTHRDTRQKWLYTAITRAAERVTVVRGG